MADTVARDASRIEEGRSATLLLAEGLSIVEIAHRLGMRPSTVKRRIELALDGADAEYEVEHLRIMVDLRLQWMQQRLAEVEADPTQKGAAARVAALNAMRGLEADRRRLWGLDYDAKEEDRA